MAQIPVIAFDDDNQFAGFDLAAEFAPAKKMPEPLLRGKAFEMQRSACLLNPFLTTCLPYW